MPEGLYLRRDSHRSLIRLHHGLRQYGKSLGHYHYGVSHAYREANCAVLTHIRTMDWGSNPHEIVRPGMMEALSLIRIVSSYPSFDVTCLICVYASSAYIDKSTPDPLCL